MNPGSDWFLKTTPVVWGGVSLFVSLIREGRSLLIGLRQRPFKFNILCVKTQWKPVYLPDLSGLPSLPRCSRHASLSLVRRKKKESRLQMIVRSNEYIPFADCVKAAGHTFYSNDTVPVPKRRAIKGYINLCNSGYGTHDFGRRVYSSSNLEFNWWRPRKNWCVYHNHNDRFVFWPINKICPLNPDFAIKPQ